ncbi:MAG: M14 family metallopeptidase [Bulleidia sp.]|nr:M14 family metallopeptidase [Bulleidia sp.]
MKTTFQYDHYYKYDELEKNLKYFSDKYPELCDLESICVTEENRNVYAMTITNKKTGAALDKPAFHIDGNTHAGEVTGSMAAMHAIDVLLTGYGEDKVITKILDRMTIYVVPRISPDGAETYLTTPYSIRSVNRVHNPENGGIRSEDLDGDGVIRMMRIPTPYGAWKKDKDDSGIMAKRDPGDADGDFYDIYVEGNFEAFDGDENLKEKKEDWSLDFNRNYPYGWFPENRQAGAGKYPLSNPETKAMADWIIEHPNIGGVSTNHTSGGIILYPPGTRPSTAVSEKDINQFIEIANMGKEELGYEPLNIYDSFIADPANYDSGAFDDWCYQSQGIVAYTVELWDLAKRVGVPLVWNARNKESAQDELKRFVACMKWVKENAPEYYEDWKPFHHETFGDVEIGGFNFKFSQQNPPESFLNGVLEQMTRFMIRFAQSMPRLTIDTLTSEKVSDDIYKVTAVVGNLGYLPTNLTEEAKNLNISKEVEVTISGGKVISGLEKTKIGNLEGYGSTSTGTNFYGNISTDYNAKARKKLTWVVQAKSGTEITVSCVQEKSGKASKTITL